MTIAASGEEAIEKASQESYDLVFMDCRLPGIDGFKATSIIRAGRTRPRLPIIALTASANEADRQRCIEAGMDDHIGKPVDLTALQETLAKWASPAKEAEPQLR